MNDRDIDDLFEFMDAVESAFGRVPSLPVKELEGNEYDCWYEENSTENFLNFCDLRD